MPTPERTTLAEIVAAARDLTEEAGASSVTMQKVADRVGVRAPSLYKRIRDRSALIEAVAVATLDELVARLEASDRSLEALAHAYRTFAHERPEGFRLLFTSVVPQRDLDRSGEVIVESMAGIVGDLRALDAARLVTAWATGFVQMELAHAFRLGGDVEAAFEFGIAALRRGLAPAAE